MAESEEGLVPSGAGGGRVLQVPVSVVFTKLDKRKKKVPKPESNILGVRLHLCPHHLPLRRTC